MSAVKDNVKWIIDNTGIDEMVLEALRAFIATSIAVALGLGIPLLDIGGGDFRTVISAGLAACLQVIVRALNPEDGKFGVGAARKARKSEEEASAPTDHTLDPEHTPGDWAAEALDEHNLN
jgi:hypothetical protein